ncbi:MAG: xylulokinase [Burkholderiaceae bacterium]|nr:xylulokinase [Burkholderiaceae bacterium]
MSLDHQNQTLKPYLMGIDIGAGSLKTMIIDLKGNVVGSASKEIVTNSPHPRWSEQNPMDWWDAVKETVPKSIAQAKIKANEIAAISFSAGAHTPVLEDANGELLRPAILWNDQRSGQETQELKDKHWDRILEVGFNSPAPTWTLPQFLWLSRNEPDVLKKTKRIYVAKDWLRSRLTNTWETDVTEAVGTLLFDAKKGKWSEELCNLAACAIETLPPIVKPTDIVGKVTQKAAQETGLAEGTPVICGTSDTSIETFGAGSINPGDGTVKLATAGTVSVVSKNPNLHKTLINYPFVLADHWYTISGTNSCASAHRWLRDTFFPAENGVNGFDLMDQMAGQVKPGSEGLIFHPYLQGERAPYWDPLLRADFIGITFLHNRAHFARALYEGIAFSLKDVLGQFKDQGIDIQSARIIGGGAKSVIWRQIVADILNIEIILTQTTDASFGAALIAGVGIGAFIDEVSAVERCVKKIEVIKPNPENVKVYKDLFEIYKLAQSQLQEVNHKLSKMVG